jgi:hypothetical protein
MMKEGELTKHENRKPPPTPRRPSTYTSWSQPTPLPVATTTTSTTSTATTISSTSAGPGNSAVAAAASSSVGVSVSVTPPLVSSVDDKAVVVGRMVQTGRGRRQQITSLDLSQAPLDLPPIPGKQGKTASVYRGVVLAKPTVRRTEPRYYSVIYDPYQKTAKGQP